MGKQTTDTVHLQTEKVWTCQSQEQDDPFITFLMIRLKLKLIHQAIISIKLRNLRVFIHFVVFCLCEKFSQIVSRVKNKSDYRTTKVEEETYNKIHTQRRERERERDLQCRSHVCEIGDD